MDVSYGFCSGLLFFVGFECSAGCCFGSAMLGTLAKTFAVLMTVAHWVGIKTLGLRFVIRVGDHVAISFC